MSRLLVFLFAVLALAWSGLSLLLYELAGAGSAAVVRITRWLGFEPSTTQWLADGLAVASDIAQWLVVFAWLIGMALLLSVVWLMRKAVTFRVVSGTQTQGSGRPHQHSRGEIIEGEVRRRHERETKQEDLDSH